MQFSRRTLIQSTLGGAAASMATAFLPRLAFARGMDPTSVTADEALLLLREGNRAFVAGEAPRYPFDSVRRHQLEGGQAPYAVLVSCSDSRVGPEQLFEQGLGALFVVRNAGSTASSGPSLGSIEYAVEHLGVPLIVVLGHSHCGAVKAAASVVEKNAEYEGAIEAMIEPIIPAVLAARGQPGDLVENAVRENVRRITRGLRSPGQPVLYPPQRAGKVKVVGAAYSLETGEVDFFDLHKAPAEHGAEAAHR